MAGILSAGLASTPRGKRERYQQLQAALWSDRASFDSHWRELGDFLLPRRTRFWPGDRNRGDKRNQNIIDSTGRFAARTLQSGLHAGLTSPARPWFKLTTPDPTLAEHQSVKEWLHLVTQRMQVVFAATNLYNSLPIIYGDIGVFGTSAMSVLDDPRDLFRCYAYPIGSYALGLDVRGRAATFVREYELSVRQTVEQFGVRRGYRDIDWSNISTTIKNLWDQGQYEAPVEVCWVVTPNDDAAPDRLEAQYLPWTSCHFEKGEGGEDRFLRESGFRTFPILAPRWDITGEDTYGTDCPGMTALGDVKQLQIMQREKAKAVKKMVDPPLVGLPELRTQKTSILPGDITYVREPQHGLRAIHEITLNLEHLERDIGQTQYRIQRAFYEDLFLMMASFDQRMAAARPTATEVQERHEEKLLALGPVLERTNDELLNPLIDRTYLLMEQAGLVPDPPPELDGVDLKVEYISILAQAQKLVAVAGLDRFVTAVAPIMQADASARHKVDVFRIIDSYADSLGIDPRIVRTTEAAQQLVDAEAQQQKAIADAQQAMALAKAAKDASGAQMGTDSALDRVVAGARAAAPAA
jgi:hypothetical protein